MGFHMEMIDIVLVGGQPSSIQHMWAFQVFLNHLYPWFLNCLKWVKALGVIVGIYFTKEASSQGEPLDRLKNIVRT